MWTRKQLKENAKAVLTKYYWTAFVVSFVMTLFAGTKGGVGYSTGSQLLNGFAQAMNEKGITADEFLDTLVENPEILTVLVVTFVIVGVIDLVIWLIATALNIFLFNPLRVGKNAYYIRQREDCGKFGNLAIAFKKGKYKGTVKTIFLRDLYLWLWYLLFVIPGIIKSYQYRLVPYIIGENPDMNWREALDESSRLMKGNKWKAFVYDLSFIGWELLSGLTLGIFGVFYVNPYKNSSDAALYEAIRYGSSAEPQVAAEA